MNKPAKAKCKRCGGPYIKKRYNHKYCNESDSMECYTERIKEYQVVRRKKHGIKSNSVGRPNEDYGKCDRHVFDKGKCIVCGVSA